jgi:hypothetical protein
MFSESRQICEGSLQYTPLHADGLSASCALRLLCLSVVNLIWTWVYPRSCWTQWWRKFLPLVIIRLSFYSHQWKQGCESVWWRAPRIDWCFVEFYEEFLGIRYVRSVARQAYFCWSLGSPPLKKNPVVWWCILYIGIYWTEVWRYWGCVSPYSALCSNRMGKTGGQKVRAEFTRRNAGFSVPCVTDGLIWVASDDIQIKLRDVSGK